MSAYELRSDEDISGRWSVIVRTADGEVMGEDGWAAWGCPEDATFTRDLSWVLDELNRLAAGSERQSWTLTQTGVRPLTINAQRQLNKYALATKIKATRELWRGLAKEAKIPKLSAMEIVAIPLHKDRRSPQDCGACAPHVKAAVDGLVDAQVIPDDSSELLHRITFEPARVCGQNGLEIRVVEA